MKNFLINNKKVIILAVIAILFVAIIATGTVLLLKNNVVKEKEPVNSGQTTKTEAEIKKEEAIKAERSKDYQKALELFEKAKAEYEKVSNEEGVIDMDAKIFIIKQKLAEST